RIPGVAASAGATGRRQPLRPGVDIMKIAVLAGDGIGPEITAQAVRVAEALGGQGLALELVPALVGGAACDAGGEPLPPQTLATCESAQAILFGAVGGPQYDALPRAQRPEQ